MLSFNREMDKHLSYLFSTLSYLFLSDILHTSSTWDVRYRAIKWSVRNGVQTIMWHAISRGSSSYPVMGMQVNALLPKNAADPGPSQVSQEGHACKQFPKDSIHSRMSAAHWKYLSKQIDENSYRAAQGGCGVHMQKSQTNPAVLYSLRVQS